MWHRLFLAILILGSACCYQHAKRRGPLAAAADSLVPPGTALTCEKPRHGYEGKLAFRVCAASSGDVSFEVTRAGLVLSLSQAWADDSLGRERATELKRQGAQLSGAAPSLDSADPRFVQWRWQVGSIATTLYHSQDGSGFLHVRNVLAP